jgi:hypothetical protein
MVVPGSAWSRASADRPCACASAGWRSCILRHHLLDYSGYYDRAAPGELWRVQRLINTFDVEEGTDSLSGEWLVEHGLADSADVDLDPVRAFREGLREMLSGGEIVDFPEPVVVRFTPSPRLEGAGPIGRSLAIIATAAADGTWERLKICPADDCRWAFCDFSRNHARTRCSMSGCGNRAKARAYRARQEPKASA